MRILHDDELRTFYRLLLRGDGWGYALIRDWESDTGVSWYQVRMSDNQLVSTGLKVDKSEVIGELG